MFFIFIFFAILLNLAFYLFIDYPIWILIINIIIFIILLIFLQNKKSQEYNSDDVLPKKDNVINNQPLEKKDVEGLFIDQFEDIIIILNKFNNIIYNNKAAVENFGINLEGKHIGSEIRIPELLEAIDQNKIDKQLKKIDIEINIPTFKFYRASVASIKSDQTLVLIRDFTEIRKSQNMRSDFIANASHELRTPLVSLKGFLETITDAAKDDPQSQKKFISIMKDEAEKMERLIEDLMSLSRIELQEHIRPKDKVNIREVIENVILLYDNKAKEKKINITCTVKDNQKFVIGDKEKLSAVFSNLLDNAIKYSNTNSVIEIKNSNHKSDIENFVSISVIDSGYGIATDDIIRITERFFRAENIKKLKIEGTGLGLAIVKHIVNQHRGEFQILSTLNKGSEFIVKLPLFQN